VKHKVAPEQQIKMVILSGKMVKI